MLTVDCRVDVVAALTSRSNGIARRWLTRGVTYPRGRYLRFPSNPNMAVRLPCTP